MNNTFQDTGMQLVLDRLTRQEERGVARDAAMVEMKTMIQAMSTRLDTVAGDVRDAKTALRVGFWISTTVVPLFAAFVGWMSRHLWFGGK